MAKDGLALAALTESLKPGTLDVEKMKNSTSTVEERLANTQLAIQVFLFK